MELGERSREGHGRSHPLALSYNRSTASKDFVFYPFNSNAILNQADIKRPRRRRKSKKYDPDLLYCLWDVIVYAVHNNPCLFTHAFTCSPWKRSHICRHRFWEATFTTRVTLWIKQTCLTSYWLFFNETQLSFCSRTKWFPSAWEEHRKEDVGMRHSARLQLKLHLYSRCP